MTGTTSTLDVSPLSRSAVTRTVAVALAGGLALNAVLEVLEALLLPELRGDLPANLALVTAWSLAAALLALGLARLGRHDARSGAVVTVLSALLGLVTVPLAFWCAAPACFAATGWALARGRDGAAHRTGAVLSVVALVAFVAVSVGMFPFGEL